MLKLNELLSPAGTVTAPAGADVSGLAGSPLSHQVTGGDDGAVPDGAADGGAEDAGAGAGGEVGVEVVGASAGAVVLPDVEGADVVALEPPADE